MEAMISGVIPLYNKIRHIRRAHGAGAITSNPLLTLILYAVSGALLNFALIVWVHTYLWRNTKES